MGTESTPGPSHSNAKFVNVALPDLINPPRQPQYCSTDSSMSPVNYSAVAGGRTSSFLNTETGFKSPLAPASHHLYFSMKNNTKQALHRNKKCYAPLNQPKKLQYCSKRQHHIIPKLWIRVQIPAPASFESSLFF